MYLFSSLTMQQMGCCCCSMGGRKESGRFDVKASQTAQTEIAAGSQCRKAPPSGQDGAPAGWLLQFQPGGGAAAGLHSPGAQCWAAGPAGCLQQHAQDVRALGASFAWGTAACKPGPHLQGMHSSTMLTEMQTGVHQAPSERLCAYGRDPTRCTGEAAISSRENSGQPGPAGA